MQIRPILLHGLFLYLDISLDSFCLTGSASEDAILSLRMFRKPLDLLPKVDQGFPRILVYQLKFSDTGFKRPKELLCFTLHRLRQSLLSFSGSPFKPVEAASSAKHRFIAFQAALRFAQYPLNLLQRSSLVAVRLLFDDA